MECNKIKSLLSEYLDKALDSDLNRDVKDHLLSCKECSNDFFHMKTIAKEMKEMERLKAPDNLLSRVNQTILERPWYLKLLDFIPGSGGFRLPMEYVTLAATAVLVFFIFTSIYNDKPENVKTAMSDNQKLLTGRNSIKFDEESLDLEFIPVSGNESGVLSSDNIFSVSRGQNRLDTQSNDILKMIETGLPSVKNNYLLFQLNEIILAAEGKIISKEDHDSTGYTNSIKVTIPSKNYETFIQRAEELGRFHPPAPSLNNKENDQVLMRIRFTVPE